MNISCTRCSPDLLGASLSDCQSVCLDISRNICLSVTRLQVRPSVRVDRNWELLGVSPSSRRRRDGTRSHPGGGPAPTVDLDRLVRLVCRHSCRAADHHLALTCPAPSIGAPALWSHTTGDTSFNAGTNAAPFPHNPRFCNNVFRVGGKSGTRHCKMLYSGQLF